MYISYSATPYYYCTYFVVPSFHVMSCHVITCCQISYFSFGSREATTRYVECYVLFCFVLCMLTFHLFIYLFFYCCCYCYCSFICFFFFISFHHLIIGLAVRSTKGKRIGSINSFIATAVITFPVFGSTFEKSI